MTEVRSCAYTHWDRPAYSAPDYMCKASSPKKGSFSAKFNNPGSRSLGFAIENSWTIEKTLDHLIALFGYNYKTHLSEYTTTLGVAHFLAGVLDVARSQDKPLAKLLEDLTNTAKHFNINHLEPTALTSLITTTIYNLNLHTNLLSGNPVAIQCAIEIGFSLLKSGTIFNLPHATIASNILTALICLNRELNSGPYQEQIHITLGFLKTALYFFSPEIIVKTISLLKSYWLLDALTKPTDPHIMKIDEYDDNSDLDIDSDLVGLDSGDENI
ncbi:MAG: hypothetical protein K0T99_01455 [Alphaproteobacteria bacterium]|nr:hypothetical protein [Alphaproteobacteria bacterium]